MERLLLLKLIRNNGMNKQLNPSLQYYAIMHTAHYLATLAVEVRARISGDITWFI